MTYQDWLALFGRTTDDPVIRSKLAEAGISQPPVVSKKRTGARVEMPGLMLLFKSEALFPDLKEPVGEGAGVLAQITLSVGDPSRGIYKGELPYGLKKTDSSDDLRARFGPPRQTNETFFWDEWRLDDIILNVVFLEGWKGIELINLMMPMPNKP